MDFDAKFDRRAAARHWSQETVRQRLARLPGLDASISLTPLSGGYRNANYRVDTAAARYVARVSQPSIDGCPEETLLALARRHIDGVPDVLVTDRPPEQGEPLILLMEFIEGVPLSRVEDDLALSDIKRIAEQIADRCAAFHKLSFPATGFFDAGLSIPEPQPSTAHMFLDYMDDCLADPLLERRLESGVGVAAVSRFIASHRACLDGAAPDARLVHSDFNQKNLMVRARNGTWDLAAVLDWEFAYSGCPLADLGNFFRFEHEQPPYRDGFISGYRAAGGTLPDTWRQMSAFLDLTAMLSFLRDPEDRPRTHETARTIIARTLTMWETL